MVGREVGGGEGLAAAGRGRQSPGCDSRPVVPDRDQCVAVGSYVDSNGSHQGLLLTRSVSSWTPAKAPPAAGAASNLLRSANVSKPMLAGPFAAELEFALLAKDRIKETLYDTLSGPAQGRSAAGAASCDLAPPGSARDGSAALLDWSRRLGAAAMELL